MVKPVGTTSNSYGKSQQVEDDFGLKKLLSHLRSHTDTESINVEEQELKSLAKMIIEGLAKSLDSKQVASYLNALRHGHSKPCQDSLNLEIPASTTKAIDNFPANTKPRYQEGDRVRWQSPGNSSDWGVIIGHFYAYAKHNYQWGICYLVWLDVNSPSADWIVADTAWEEDLVLIVSQDLKDSLPNLINKRQSLHAPPGSYKSDNPHQPTTRQLSQREQELVQLYSECQLAMTPKHFYHKWQVSHDILAMVCSRSTSTVRHWFSKGKSYRRPNKDDLRNLALMDFVLEHFESIPAEVFSFLCAPK
ncbi:MAG: hypothetical protein WA865_16160 [Spirulinaceae cyanobacterium]